MSNQTSKEFLDDVTRALLVLRPHLYFDWWPIVDEGRITFRAQLDYGDQKTAIDFQTDINRLLTNEQERLHQFLARRKAGMTTPAEMAFILAWLLDLSITQNSADLTAEKRQQKILQLLLITSLEHAKANPLGVSPLLIVINRRGRNRLRKKHGISVEELERESCELFNGLTRFRELPRGPDTITKAEAYNKLIIAHHEKVRRTGDLLGGLAGKALATQARLAIEELSSPL
jgi:hypothetical protein